MQYFETSWPSSWPYFCIQNWILVLVESKKKLRRCDQFNSHGRQLYCSQYWLRTGSVQFVLALSWAHWLKTEYMNPVLIGLVPSYHIEIHTLHMGKRDGSGSSSCKVSHDWLATLWEYNRKKSNRNNATNPKTTTAATIISSNSSLRQLLHCWNGW